MAEDEIIPILGALAAAYAAQQAVARSLEGEPSRTSAKHQLLPAGSAAIAAFVVWRALS